MGGVYFCAKYIYIFPAWGCGAGGRGESHNLTLDSSAFYFCFFTTIGALTQGSSSGATYLDSLEGLSAILLFCYNACISVTHVSRIHTSACCRIYIYCMLRSLIRDGSDLFCFFIIYSILFFLKKERKKANFKGNHVYIELRPFGWGGIALKMAFCNLLYPFASSRCCVPEVSRVHCDRDL